MGHSLCHHPLDIVGIEGGVPALLQAGVVHREELKHTHQDLKAGGDHLYPLSPSFRGQRMPILLSHRRGSYLHIHDAAGLRGCEPKDFESKRREMSDAHQSLIMGSSHPEEGSGKVLSIDIKMDA